MRFSAQHLLATVCPLRPSRADPTLPPPRTRESGPALPSASTSPRRLCLGRWAWPLPPAEALTVGDACGCYGTTGVSGLRPACGCKCSPSLAILVEMLHPRCRHGPTRRRDVGTDGDTRRWHRPTLVASGGSGRWSREWQQREGAREWCCGAIRMWEPSSRSSLMSSHIR
jgi:hypothetical protein